MEGGNRERNVGSDAISTEDKIKIEKNTVQETLVIPLYGRKMSSEKFTELFFDDSAKELCEKIDYDFSEVEKKSTSFSYEFSALEVAMRQTDMMWEVREYLKKFPKAAVVNLGCGLDETGKACDNGLCKLINIDLPDVIALREKLIVKNDRETNISCDIKGHRFMEKIDSSEGAIFFAAGVFYYFKREEVKALVEELEKRFPKGCLVFDTAGKTAVKLMHKTLKTFGMHDVEAMFYVDDLKRDLNFGEGIKVSAKGYMLGYSCMNSPKIKFLHKLLSKIADNIMKMRIIKIEF